MPQTGRVEPRRDEKRRGRLRVFLGAAPGVGKTFAALDEAHRRRRRGTDVVVGLVECHGRERTEALLAGLEVLPRRTVEHRGLAVAELDVEAVLRRRPEVVVVDELAHTNAPGSKHPKRWQDVEEILAAGVDVVSTVNIQHLESLNDVVEHITGIEQRETVPDAVLRSADQVQLVDMTPEALQRRISHGNVYAGDRVDAALSNYFRTGNLTALRELALLWLADRVDEGLERYRAQQGIDATWPARERVVVALTGGAEGATLVRRAARLAGRGAGGELHAVHVARGDGLLRTSPVRLAEQRELVETLGGTYHQVVGDDVATSLLEFARGVNASQIVVGASRHRRLASLFRRSVGDGVVRGAGAVDVLVVTHEEQARRSGLPRPARAALSGTRRVLGWLVALLGPLLVTGVLLAIPHQDLSTDLMVFLVVVVGAALAGGVLPALAAALVAGLAVNWFFTEPLHRFTIAQPANAVALAVFLLVALAVSSTVDTAARRTRDAARSRAESEALSVLTRTALLAADPLAEALRHTRETFAVDSVTLLERSDVRAPWAVAAATGAPVCTRPADADAEVVLDDLTCLVLRGRLLGAGDRRVLEVFATQIAAVRQKQRLRAEAAQVRRLEEGEAVRGALLTAVSHDLRTPLATLKASLDSLRAKDIDLPEEIRDELLAEVGNSADRLQGLIDDLLDLTRVRSGTVEPLLVVVDLEDVVAGAVRDVGPGRVVVDLPPGLPPVSTDPGLLQRVVANLVQNAVRHGGTRVEVVASSSTDDARRVVRLLVVDHGPGLPDAAKERAFTPFQRLGDRSTAGLGLGLAVARGLAEAVGGRLEAQDTPGGGLTMVLDLPPAGHAQALVPAPGGSPA
ncbi:osmosensitive K+ channel signal transduction histidine kinase [Kineococcus radiotolerans SRS30216 = ATCC BAA-149]|uniref:histidine kinase n=1 Tax=Kineococcus radiotolerans (strain ATCC BAA-149 / DSM 14245 / SRS30216) TaxID=266940 RepID=A6W6R8_KINRD|nr:osmosensitive K+ channel signal transduction histidine kinase [Kineococcus radiotolerans SRS30216 = ATCC BAA-149]